MVQFAPRDYPRGAFARSRSVVRPARSALGDTGGSAISSPRISAFMASVCRRALAQGWLRLWTLEIDGIPAAASMGWRVGDRYAYYLPGFDPAYGNRSPGLLLLARTIEAAIEEGAAEYDFLLGDEQYKSRFANAVREVETEILGPRWSSHVLVVRCERTLRRIGRVLPAPARARVHSQSREFSTPSRGVATGKSAVRSATGGQRPTIGSVCSRPLPRRGPQASGAAPPPTAMPPGHRS